MCNEPLLSIIVPVYKTEKYIIDCIDSILNQKFTNFELILVDDGSPDKCSEICDQYSLADERVKVIHKKNGGLSSARNAGIEIARGDYLTFVDSDDTISPDTYSANMDILQHDSSIDLLEYPVYVYYGSPKQFIWQPQQKYVKGKENVFVDWICEHRYSHAYAWNKIYKKKLFNYIRFPIGKTFEDIHTLPNILKETNHLYISERGLYYYYYRPDSISTSISYNKLQDRLEAYLILLREMKNYPIKQEEISILYLSIINILIEILRTPQGKDIYNITGISALQEFHLSFRSLIHLNVPLKVKFKNLPLAIFGLSFHCRIYTCFHKS